MTTATLLTPPGTGAIATIELHGPEAAKIAGELFSKPLPSVGQFRFGTFLGDEVVLARIGDDHFEIHCHGGRGLVEMMLSELTTQSVTTAKPTRNDELAFVANAPTFRTANILLDQLHNPPFNDIERLAALIPLGKHLITPWKVVIAGAPNVGKSSLINTLAGYERAIVSPVAGTTRDAVSTIVALDGWPVELTDTAGLRQSSDPLETAGIDRAREVLAVADVVVWVLDATAPVEPVGLKPHLIIANKCDLTEAPPATLAVSSKTGAGVAALIGAIMRILVPVSPVPGEAVPHTPALAEAVLEARALAAIGRTDDADARLAAAS